MSVITMLKESLCRKSDPIESEKNILIGFFWLSLGPYIVLLQWIGDLTTPMPP